MQSPNLDFEFTQIQPTPGWCHCCYAHVDELHVESYHTSDLEPVGLCTYCYDYMNLSVCDDCFIQGKEQCSCDQTELA